MSASKWKPYPQYKKIGFGWIDSIPNHWNISRIKRIHRQTTNSFIDGDWVESPYIVDNEKIRYITSGNIGEGNFKFQGSGHISEESFEELSCIEIFPGDLIISRLSLPVGRSCIIPDLGKRIITAVDNVIIRLNSKCNKHFFNYLFNCFESYENTSQLARGTTLQRISRTILGNVETLIPPLNEQGKIVDFLDAQCDLINPIIQQLEKERNLLEEKRSSLITQAVTKGLNPDVSMKDSDNDLIREIPAHWSKMKLGYFSKISRGSGYQNLNIVGDDFEGEKEKVIRIADFLSFNPMWCEYNQQFENYRINAGDILVGGTGHHFGKSIYASKEMHGLIHSYNILRIAIRGQDPEFIQYYLSSSIIRTEFDLSSLGSAQPFIDIQGLADLPVLIPPSREQREIAKFLREQEIKIQSVREKIETQIEKIKEYRTSLISAAVTGKIDLRSL